MDPNDTLRVSHRKERRCSPRYFLPLASRIALRVDLAPQSRNTQTTISGDGSDHSRHSRPISLAKRKPKRKIHPHRKSQPPPLPPLHPHFCSHLHLLHLPPPPHHPY